VKSRCGLGRLNPPQKNSTYAPDYMGGHAICVAQPPYSCKASPLIANHYEEIASTLTTSFVVY